MIRNTYNEVTTTQKVLSETYEVCDKCGKEQLKFRSGALSITTYGKWTYVTVDEIDESKIGRTKKELIFCLDCWSNVDPVLQIKKKPGFLENIRNNKRNSLKRG